MLFYLFQFVFHFNDEFLDVVVVGFRAHGVDLPTDFLSDKTDFPARSIFMFDRFQKVFTAVSYTHLIGRFSRNGVIGLVAGLWGILSEYMHMEENITVV